MSTQQTVRDAMVPEPTTLRVGDSAQAAGACFAEREDVRAVFVVEDDGTLVGVITRKTLVREVVAAGRAPNDVRLREIAEPPRFTLSADLPLDDEPPELDPDPGSVVL
jgi:CBS domain-containing protein